MLKGTVKLCYTSKGSISVMQCFNLMEDLVLIDLIQEGKFWSSRRPTFRIYLLFTGVCPEFEGHHQTGQPQSDVVPTTTWKEAIIC